MAKSIQPKSKPKSGPNRPANLTVGLWISVIGMLIYGNTLGHQYTLDDFSVIKDNFVTKKGLEGIGTILTTDYRYGYWISGGTLYRPLSLIMFAIEWSFAPDSPFVGQHFRFIPLTKKLHCSILNLADCSHLSPFCHSPNSYRGCGKHKKQR